MRSFIRKSLRGLGWGNGYVILPGWHCLNGYDFDFINQFVSVNGGLTFSKSVNNCKQFGWTNFYDEDIGGWVVGFDTARIRNKNWTKKMVIEETKHLHDQLLEVHEKFKNEIWKK